MANAEQVHDWQDRTLGGTQVTTLANGESMVLDLRGHIGWSVDSTSLSWSRVSSVDATDHEGSTGSVTQFTSYAKDWPFIYVEAGADGTRVAVL